MPENNRHPSPTEMMSSFSSPKAPSAKSSDAGSVQKTVEFFQINSSKDTSSVDESGKKKEISKCEKKAQLAAIGEAPSENQQREYMRHSLRMKNLGARLYGATKNADEESESGEDEFDPFQTLGKKNNLSSNIENPVDSSPESFAYPSLDPAINMLTTLSSALPTLMCS